MSNVNIVLNDTFYVTAATNDLRVEYPTRPIYFTTAIEIAQELVDKHNFDYAYVCKGDTGEIAAEITKEEDDEDYYFDNCDDDCGFDAYMGCYTDEV